MAINVVGCIGILCEDENLLLPVFTIEQLLQHVQFLVILRFPLSTKLYHCNQLVAVLAEVRLERTLEIRRVYPADIVLLCQLVVVGTSLFHIDFHVCWYLDIIVTTQAVFLLFAIAEDIVDVCIFRVFIRQRILITNGQRQVILDGIHEDGVTQNVAIERQQERETAAVHTFEECTLAETHHTFAGTREILQQFFVRL